MTASSGGSPTLRELREAAGVSLGQIVRVTDYSKGHLSKVENGLRPASPRLVRVYESLQERPSPVPIPKPSRRSTEGERLIAASYGGEVRRARSALGLSQRELARLAGLSHVYISKIETGRALGTPYVAGLLDRRLGQAGALIRLFRAEASRVPAPVTIPHVAFLSGLRPTRPPAHAEAVLTDATVRLERLRVRRHLAGPAAVVNDVAAHLAELHTTAAAVPVKHAQKLRQLEARYAEYLSWLAEELGDTTAMRDWLALAVQLGSDNGDTGIAGYAAIRQSATALRADRPCQRRLKSDSLSTVES
jgi:transcriptional regulator with XRE-family HTH domain